MIPCPPTPTLFPYTTLFRSWDQLTGELDAYGCALTPPLLTPDETGQIAALYDRDECFPGHREHGPAPLRPGRVPLLPAAVPRARPAATPGALPAAAAGRPGLAPPARPARPV